LQNPGLDETIPQEAPPEDAPTPQQCTSPTAAYKLQKDKLQRFHLNPLNNLQYLHLSTIPQMNHLPNRNQSQ